MNFKFKRFIPESLREFTQLIIKRNIEKWFATVDLPISRWRGDVRVKEDLVRAMWRVTYRDIRQYAHIAAHKNNELVLFRGFGVLKRVWKNNTVIGRIRVNDVANFDNNTIAARFELTDYNPDRILVDN